MANSQASLAIMQADIDKALQQKQQTHAEQASKLSSIDAPSTLQSAEPLLNSVEMADNSVLDEVQLSRVIEMAWEDRTPFAAIEHSYGLNEAAVINLMRQQLKPSSFRLWRQRVTGRNTKHQAKRSFEVGRAYCKTQYKQR